MIKSGKMRLATVQGEDYTKRVLAVAIGAGELMLRSGAETTRVEDTVNSIAKGYGFSSSHCLSTPTGLYVSLDDPSLDTPVTLVHRVSAGTTHYSRISAVNDLSRRIANGQVPLEQAERELAQIRVAPNPYKFWFWLVCGAASAAGIALLLGGGPLELAAGFTGTILVLCVTAFLERFEVPAFFGYMMGGAIATAVALGLLALGLPIHANL